MSDRPHRIHQREARRISQEQGIGYQAALTQVRGGAPGHQGTPAVPSQHLITFGYPELDAALSSQGGAPMERIMLLRGKAGTGKTRWMMDALIHQANSGRDSLFVPLEYTAEWTAKYIKREAARIDSESGYASRARPGGGPALDSITIHSNEGMEGPMSSADIEAALVQARKRRRIDLVCVDPINLLKPATPGVEGLLDEEKMWVVAQELVDLAKSHHVFILVSDWLPKTVPPGAHFQEVKDEREYGSSKYLSLFDYIVQIWRPSDESKMWGLSLDKNRYGPGARFSVPLLS